jgi:hypothetical protein
MIGGMVPSRDRLTPGKLLSPGKLLLSPGKLLLSPGNALTLLLALALAAFSVGCDATGGDDEREKRTSEEAVGEGASELGGNEAPGADTAEPPGGDRETDTHVDGQSGIGSPLDDRSGPDPIPWHRSLRDETANDA